MSLHSNALTPTAYCRQVAITGGNFAVNSTVAAAVPGLSITIPCPGPGAIYTAELDPYLLTGTNHVLIMDITVDGINPNAIQLVFSGFAATQHKKWVLTGMAAGNRVVVARAYMQSAATSGTVAGTHSTMTVTRMA